MICGKFHFKRVVVSVGGGSPSQTIRFAAGLARQFELELCGLFVEDARLLDLARLPFLREFRPLGGGWHPLDTARLSDELETARRMAERAFAEATRQLHATSRFEVVSGATAEMLATLSPSGDLLVIDVPASPDAETGDATAAMIDQAFRSADAVVLLPRKIVRTAGPVIAIGEAGDDPVMGAAAQIAQALGETVVTIELPKAFGREESDLAAAAHALGTLQERMIVLRHRRDGSALARHLASTRRVPVLLLDHDTEPSDGERDMS